MSPTPLTWPTMLPKWCRRVPSMPRHQRGLVIMLTMFGMRQLGRRAQAVLQVLVALAEDLQVERQHQRAALRGLGAVDQALDEVAVAHHVELEPERRLGVRGDVLDRADAHRRQRERDAEFLGRARRQDFAVGVLHAGQARRRDGHRHRDVDADHRRRGAAVLHVDGHALAQLDLGEVALVGAVGALGPRAGIGIVVEHARHALLAPGPAGPRCW